VLSDRATPDPISLLEPCLIEPILKKELKKKKERIIYSKDSNEFQLSQLLLLKILEHIPGYKLPDLQNWSEEMDLLIRVDKRPVEEIRAVILFAQIDPFWQSNILSVKKLRKQYDALNGKRLTKRNLASANANRNKKKTRENSEEADEYKKFFS